MKKAIPILLITTSFLLACNGGSGSEDFTYGSHKDLYTQDRADAQNKSPEVFSKKIIREGNISFKTGDIEKSIQHIKETIDKYEAHISDENSNKETFRINYNYTVKIPSKNFDKFVDDLSSKIDNMEYKNISSQDVTEEYIDIEVRLKTKKELESRYRELLESARTVSEMLELEREINYLRSEIESIEGRLKYLSDRVSFGTLQISFYKNIPQTVTFFENASFSFSKGWNNFKLFGLWLINLWPFVIILSIGFIFWRARRRRRA